MNSGSELALARSLAKLGPERLRDILPHYPDSAPVIIQPGTGTWRGAPVPSARGRVRLGAAPAAWAPRWMPSASLALDEVPVVPPLAEDVLDWAAMSRASNSWVISGAHTRSGKPILANDPHLELRAPSLWYLAAIESPGFHVAGATIPGLPPVIIGRNRRIAWGLTNMGADDVDYVIERLSADSSRVLTTDGWQPVEVVREPIRVRGGPDVPFVLRRTGHGPLADAPPPASGPVAAGEVRVLALRWNAHDPSDELTALFGVDRADSWDAFLAAVSRFKVPEQNWIYADVDGNIGYTASGNVPVRRAGSGLLPTPGWTDEGAWVRYLDFDELPRVLNPPDGFIVTANNRIIGDEYQRFITGNWDLGHRAARIRELILAGRALTADDVRVMQMDTLDVFARWAKELAARAADGAGRGDLARELRAWDGTMGSDRTEPSLFWSWYRALQRLTYEDELDGYAPSEPLQRWMHAGGSPWFDDVRTPEREDLAALSLRAMREAIPAAAGRRWGDLHRTVSRHPLGSVRALDLLLRLNAGPLPRAGSLYTVDVADFGMTPPFTNRHAPSLRQVADLADVEAGTLVLTTGQSGNPLSRHYRDQVRRWWSGESVLVPLSAGRVAGAARLRLAPAR